jgi:hemoglobin
MMRTIGSLSAASAAVILLSGCQASLYERLGKREGITAAVDDFAGRFFAETRFDNARVKRRFAVISIAAFRDHVINQLCSAAGGPEKYTGRDMKSSHVGLRISNKEYDVFIDLWKKTLTDRKVPPQETKEVLDLLEAQRKDIVDESHPDPKSLYARLGGRAGITKVTDAFLEKLTADMNSAEPKIVNAKAKARFAGVHVPLVREHFINLIGELSGGPETYIGRDMTASHAGMAITEKEFDGFVALLGEVLAHAGVGAKEKDEVLAVMKAQKAAIVGK